MLQNLQNRNPEHNKYTIKRKSAMLVIKKKKEKKQREKKNHGPEKEDHRLEQKLDEVNYRND